MPGAGRLPHPSLAQFVPRAVNGVMEIPLYHVRGGTSTGVVLWHEHLPADLALKEEAIRWIMGVPVSGERRGNKQTTGLGRGIPTSNKVFIVAPPADDRADVTSTFAQLAADKSAIDWSVNCGNLSAALPMYALDTGLFRPAQGTTAVRIYNTNTRVITDGLVKTPQGTPYIPADTEIPGVMGSFPGVDLSLREPVGAKTGKLLPTGKVVDRCDGIDASCVDVAVPMVIVRAADLGKTARESVEELAADQPLKRKLQAIWVEAGLKMGLKNRSGSPMTADELAASETIPKICMVAPPVDGENILVRYFTPQTPHGSLAVTGGCCLAAASLLPGTVAHGVARELPVVGAKDTVCTVGMRNPAGVLRARIGASAGADGMRITYAAYERSAQIFLRGHFPLYCASAKLREFGERFSA